LSKPDGFARHVPNQRIFALETGSMTIMPPISKSKRKRLLLALKFEGKPCKQKYSECHCCLSCGKIVDCYEAWRRGHIRHCIRHGGAQPNNERWCLAAARRVAQLLHEKETFDVPMQMPVNPKRIEEWEDEGTKGN